MSEEIKGGHPGYLKLLDEMKELHCRASNNKILVDDNDSNCEKFAAAGGRIVKVPRPWNSLIGSCHPGGFFEVRDVFATLKIQVQTIY